jgi:phospholipid/cholesterol/gamma-HCH transport system ATP-binding protein
MKENVYLCIQIRKMIEVKNLYKSFEETAPDGTTTSKDVLKDISTTFEDGITNLIIGRSGSGKTVLMKNLVGLLEPTSGQVLYDGRDFVRMSKQEKVFMRREMGMIFQSAALFDSMTVLENVMFPLDMFSQMTLRERERRAKECLDRVSLTDADQKFPGEISGGMQKRVAIARAIALQPKYLFCDEPNSGLDPKTSLVIDDLLHSITHEYKMTTIINTHDMNSVMGIGENIIFIYEGHKEWQGQSGQIMDSTNTRLTDFIFASGLQKKMREAVLAGSHAGK